MYFTILVALYNFFWATVENSHLAMIPEISSSSNQRGFLTTVRNAVFALSNSLMYFVLWRMLGTGKLLVVSAYVCTKLDII